MYTCIQCKLKFISVSQLINHLRSLCFASKDLTNFSCGEEGCFRHFSCLGSLRKHLNKFHCQSDHNTDTSETMIMSTSLLQQPNYSSLPSPDNTCNQCTLTPTNLDHQVALFVSTLYGNPIIPRSVVQIVIDSLQFFFIDSVENMLRSRLIPLMNQIPEHGNMTSDLNEILSKFKNLLTGFNTEHKRFQNFTNIGTYIALTQVVIGQRMEQKRTRMGLSYMPVDCHMQVIPIGKVLQSFFSLSGILRDTLNYTNSLLMSSSKDICNFIQGSVWSSVSDSPNTNELLLPLILYYDDFEIGNPLGSHAGIHKLGGVYISCPCLPPKYISKLKNIFMIALFHSSDRITYGNKCIFKKVIEELNILSKTGITVSTDDFKGTIKFRVGAITGDNLGLKSMLGFVESFTANHPCRICNASRVQIQNMLVEDSTLMRNERNYENMLQIAGTFDTGIKEQCVWSSLDGFNLFENVAVDLLHDMLEGCCKYVMSLILTYFIKELKVIHINIIQKRIEAFDFGPDTSSKPTTAFSFEDSAVKFRMSASETLTFVRYFGLLLGYYVPREDHFWKLYILLRTILERLLSHRVFNDTCDQLVGLISEFNGTYIRLSKQPLKPKFHFLIHYPNMLQKFGPLVHLWTMRFEAKHIVSKKIARSTSSRVNICKTIAIKNQLHLNDILIKKEINTGLLHGKKKDVSPHLDLNKKFNLPNDSAVELFTSTAISGELKEEILRHTAKLRNKAATLNLGPELRFAVRSSAVGEDSEALSAAGQNETVLGCESDDDVLNGVQRCWASMFAFTSAYYRRQNGQPCNMGGAVVVQALVRPTAAGVMFSRHPDAGDPTRILITANYGLGESVVSGAVEPDTVIIGRSVDDRLTITNVILGSKTSRITATGRGVGSEAVPEAERARLCITEQQALELARIGISQDEMWGAGRDIEWAVVDNQIYLLQARPITSLERWTEEELLHELDSPIMADDELSTFANTGEVFPKPMSAMTLDLVANPLDEGVRKAARRSPGHDVCFFVTHNRLVIAAYNTMYRLMDKIDISIRMLEMSVHGHAVANEETLRVVSHRHIVHKSEQWAMLAVLFKLLFTSGWLVKECKKIANNIKIHKKAIKDPQALIKEIANTNEDITKIMFNHGRTTVGSNGMQLIAMAVLLEGATEFTPEQISEIGVLFSCGDVLSAEVPQHLDRLSYSILESGKAEEFRKLDPKDAMQWLETNLPSVHKEVCSFLDKHGFRAVMEFDLATVPWALAPEKFMEVLQNLRPAPDKKDVAAKLTETDVVASLTSPKKSSTRVVLRWVVRACRRAVRHREGSKAALILAVHRLRLALLELGKLMKTKWLLPSEDLVFHFRLHELQEYLTSRDPALLKKAMQRRQCLSAWGKLRFPEMNTGWPCTEPVGGSGAGVTVDGGREIRATSVCGGNVLARACVVTDLSEIGQLREGDVLITHSTDIGWSPYFPLLSGIVTELGGLISHGAVIAREYGLPCLVGATNATYMFRTGDMVRLDATAGILQAVTLEKSPKDEAKTPQES